VYIHSEIAGMAAITYEMVSAYLIEKKKKKKKNQKQI
jgi:hypothetical protein